MSDDMKQLFDGFDPSTYEAEAQERWANTEAYAVSQERTRGYSKADWQAVTSEQSAIYVDAMRAKQEGRAPEEPEVLDIAERHRLSIDRWFYPCSHQAHVGLADMYEADRRFADNIDKHGEGLTEYLAEAIRANAQRRGKD